MQVKSKDWQEFGGWTRESEHGEPLWQYWRKEGVWMESMTMGVGMSGSGDFFFKGNLLISCREEAEVRRQERCRYSSMSRLVCLLTAMNPGHGADNNNGIGYIWGS